MRSWCVDDIDWAVDENEWKGSCMDSFHPDYRCNDGSVLNINDLAFFMSFDETLIKGEDMKREIMQYITYALQRLADMNSNIEVRRKHEKEGVIIMKLLAGTYSFMAYRGRDFAKKRDQRRRLLQHKGRWLLFGLRRQTYKNDWLKQN